MPDLARFLPLSQRRSGDQSRVTGDRRAEVAAVVAEAARLVAARGDAAALSASFLTRARLRGIRPGTALPPAVDAVAERRRSIRELATTVRAHLLLCEACAAEPDVDPMTLGAVALYAAGRARLERRAVVAGRTITATDADWAFGTGPAFHAPALEIAAFLLGTGDMLTDRLSDRPR